MVRAAPVRDRLPRCAPQVRYRLVPATDEGDHHIAELQLGRAPYRH